MSIKNMKSVTQAEGHCSKRDDKTHCEHWWDGEGCCACGAPKMTDAQKREQGMIE